jgi:sulfatase maturation enzyme AslB (radical SAM superfamily)
MRALLHDRQEHAEWFVVNWCLGNTCNFKCSYCPDVLHDGSSAWPTLDEIKSFVDRVLEQKPKKKVAFEFTGGEVTVYKHIKSRGAAVAFISNGSRTARWWTSFADKADHVCLSFHAEEGDPDHFLEIVNIASRNIKVHVNVMMHPKKWDTCMDLAEKVCQIPNITLALQPLIIGFGEELYHYEPWQNSVFENQWNLFQKRIPHDDTIIRQDVIGFAVRGAMREVIDGTLGSVKQPHILIAEKKNNWDGWSCAAGQEQIIVDMDGTVWRGWCRQGGCIGNIKDPGFMLPRDWVICGKSFCHCNFDIMCTKVEQE